MKERVLVFGQKRNLLGICCEPDNLRSGNAAPAVLLWNVGIHHRVGPLRIFVDLARALADE